MTRARKPDREKARLMWLRSGKTLKLKEIAEKLSKPVDTISRWKREDHWGDKKSTKNQTKKKDQRGAPLGNQNAAGHGAPLGNSNRLVHGRYSKMYWDTVSQEELEMAEDMPFDTEDMLKDQLRLYSIRERRYMQLIAKYKGLEEKARSSVTTDSTSTFLCPEKDNSGKIITDESGKFKRIEHNSIIRTVPIDSVIQSLEAELTKLQEKKLKCILALQDIQDKKKGDQDKGPKVLKVEVEYV